jgi:hypothetical protein
MTRGRQMDIGHTIQRDISQIRTALMWAPEGKRRRERPKNTWMCTVEI